MLKKVEIIAYISNWAFFGCSRSCLCFFEHVHLMDLKHFADVFLPIIVTGYLKEDHFLCFNEKNKTLNLSHNISHFLCPILHKEPFNEIRGTVGNISEFMKNLILWQHEASAEKMCHIAQCTICHNSAQFEKLNICIVCYVTKHQNSWISKFIYNPLLTKLEVFILKRHFLGKYEM